MTPVLAPMASRMPGITESPWNKGLANKLSASTCLTPELPIHFSMSLYRELAIFCISAAPFSLLLPRAAPSLVRPRLNMPTGASSVRDSIKISRISIRAPSQVFIPDQELYIESYQTSTIL